MTRQQQQRKHAQRVHHQRAQAMRRQLALEDAEEQRKRQKKGKKFVEDCMIAAGYTLHEDKWRVAEPMSREMRERVNAAVI